MNNGDLSVQIIARIRSPFPEKFGIPRQAGRVPQIRSEIVFEPEFRNSDALRGLDGFSHLWLIWWFSEAEREGWSPTVRPPRLGGNQRMGVFATRSPFRPNPVGLSCVKIAGIRNDPKIGTVITVEGADLMDGTPILDIKPYLPAADCVPGATGGFAEPLTAYRLTVSDPEKKLDLLPVDLRSAVIAILSEDPRPGYQHDPIREYSFAFSGYRIRFRVPDGQTAEVLSVFREDEKER